MSYAVHIIHITGVDPIQSSTGQKTVSDTCRRIDPYLIFCNNYHVDFLDMDEVQLTLCGQLTVAILSVLPQHEMCICFRVAQSITLRSLSSSLSHS